jgi:hypothetical protein
MIITAQFSFSDLLTGVKQLWTKTQGTAAHDAVANGNPVQIGGVYRATDPNVADGDVASLRVNNKGEVLTQLSGRVVEEQVLGSPGTVLTDTISKSWGTVTNYTKYKRFAYLINNTHDAVVTFTINPQSTSLGGSTNVWNGAAFAPASIDIPANLGRNIFVTDENLNIKGMFNKAQAVVQAKTVPTTGALTIYLLGVLN